MKTESISNSFALAYTAYTNTSLTFLIAEYLNFHALTPPLSFTSNFSILVSLVAESFIMSGAFTNDKH